MLTLEEKKGSPRDAAQAVEALRKGCDAGNVKACSNVATLLAPREGLVTRDVAASARYFGKACDGGLGHSCWRLAGLYAVGDGVPENHGRAADLYRKSLTLGGLSQAQQSIAEGALASLQSNGRFKGR